MMMGYGYDGGSGWMWGFGGLMMLGALVLIGLGMWAIAATNRTHHLSAGAGTWGSGTPDGRDQTRQVLDERYARGEMTTDDYTDRLHTRGL
jgi:putative membrane protein